MKAFVITMVAIQMLGAFYWTAGHRFLLALLCFALSGWGAWTLVA